MTSFREIPSLLADASNTTLVFVVALSGLMTVKWGKYHDSLGFFLRLWNLSYIPLGFVLITSELHFPISAGLHKRFSVFCNRLSAVS